MTKRQTTAQKESAAAKRAATRARNKQLALIDKAEAAAAAQTATDDVQEAEVIATDPAAETPQDPKQDPQPPKESRVKKSTKRQPPPAPEPDPFPNDKQMVWVKNVGERPHVCGIKYLSPGEVRKERWGHVKAADQANPNVLQWRRANGDPWTAVKDPG